MPNYHTSTIYYEGVCVQSAVLKGRMIKQYCLTWDVDLYAPQGVDLGGVAPPQEMVWYSMESGLSSKNM